MAIKKKQITLSPWIKSIWWFLSSSQAASINRQDTCKLVLSNKLIKCNYFPSQNWCTDLLDGMESHSRPYHLSDNPLKMLQMAQTAWKQCRGPVQLLQLAEVTPAVIGYSPETCQSKQPHCKLHCPGVWVRKYQLPIQWLRREETIITGLICIGPGFFYAPRSVILTRKSLGMDLLLESASSSHWAPFLALLLLLHFSVLGGFHLVRSDPSLKPSFWFQQHACELIFRSCDAITVQDF